MSFKTDFRHDCQFFLLVESTKKIKYFCTIQKNIIISTLLLAACRPIKLRKSQGQNKFRELVFSYDVSLYTIIFLNHFSVMAVIHVLLYPSLVSLKKFRKVVAP